jgi:hypothetical protein
MSHLVGNIIDEIVNIGRGRVLQTIKVWEFEFLLNFKNWFVARMEGNTTHVQVILDSIKEPVDARVYTLVKYLNEIGIPTHVSCEEDSGTYGIGFQPNVSEKIKDLVSKNDIEVKDSVENEYLYYMYLDERNYVKLLHATIFIWLGKNFCPKKAASEAFKNRIKRNCKDMGIDINISGGP